MMNHIKSFSYTGIILSIFIFIFSSTQLFSDDMFTVSEVKEILSDFDGMKGEIRNVKVAPFNNNIISFELKNRRSIKIYLFNMITRHLIGLKSVEYAYGQSRKTRYSVKEFGIEWHPTSNAFVYVSNAYKNRNKLFFCKIKNPDLATKYSLKGSLIKLDEDEDEKSKCKSPSFDITGNELVFSRRGMYDKKSMYDICLITNFNKLLTNNSFENIVFEIVVKDVFNQTNPSYSPSYTDRLVAYISYSNLKKRKQKNYIAEYEIRIIDLDTRKTFLVDEMEGFKDYPFKWSDDGKKLLYSKAKSRLLVDPKLLKMKKDQITLRIAEIRKVSDKVFIMPISNKAGYSVVVDDIIASKRGFIFYDKSSALVTKYNPDNSTSIVFVDLLKWRDSKKEYIQFIESKNDLLNPILNNDKDILTCIEYDYNNDNYVISKCEIKRIIPKSKIIQPVLVVTEEPEIEIKNSDTEEYEFEEDDEYDEETILADEIIVIDDVLEKYEKKKGTKLDLSLNKETEINSKNELIKDTTTITSTAIEEAPTKKEKKVFEIGLFKEAILEIYKEKDFYSLSEIIDVLQNNYNYKHFDINKNLFLVFRDLSIDKRNEGDKVIYFIKGKSEAKITKDNKIDMNKLPVEKSNEVDDVNKNSEDEYTDDEEEDDDFSDEEDDEIEHSKDNKLKTKKKPVKRTRRD